MQIILEDKEKYLLRFDAREEIITLCVAWAKERGIAAGFFNAIGAAEEVVLAFYDLKKKHYEEKSIQDLEIVNLIGNVGKREGEVTLHAHGVFSDREFRAWAGHVKSLIVSATCEMTFTRLDGEIRRAHDDSTGLYLMK